jgi:galactitol-specific phosphotransferase system IIB component
MRKNINCLESITVEAETVATTVKTVATTVKTAATTAATTKSELHDFLKFYELISTELKTLESSIAHVEKEEKKPHLFGIGLNKLKDQINADLHQIQSV